MNKAQKLLIAITLLAGCAPSPPLTTDAPPTDSLLPLDAPAFDASAPFPCARVFLLGDSTTRNTGPGMYGYGDALPFIVDVPVQNWGASGATTTSYLAGQAWRTVTPLLAGGDCVVISFGINDAQRGVPIAQFAANQHAMADLIVSKGARPIVVGPIAIVRNAALLPYAIGADFDLNAATLAAFMGRSDVYQPDGVHLTATGAMLIARKLLAELAGT